MSARDQLTRLFTPQSLVVVGASADPAKRGYQAIRALREAGYPHPIYAVNPKGGSVLGVAMRESLHALPRGVDVALIALPAPGVPQALRDCAAAGIAGAIVLANGFRESGPAGAELEKELITVVAETGIRIVGPNTSGMLNTAIGANLVGVPDAAPGPISVITQSGNLLLSLLADNKALRGPGFHTYIGLGNQADLSYDECVTHLARQPTTKAIAVHSEGMRNGRAFLAALADAVPRCPVVLLRGGRSEIGRRTALSHTGSIASSDAVATAVLRQAGAELVERSDELAVLASVLATTDPIRPDHAVAVLSDGGGHAALAADALTQAGVRLAELSNRTKQRLHELLGPRASVHNPIDVAGATDTNPTLFGPCVDALMGDPDVGLVLICGMYGGYHLRFAEHLRAAEDATARELLRHTRQHAIPLVIQSCYAAEKPDNHTLLRENGVQVLTSIDHAARAVAALQRRGLRLATTANRSRLALPKPIQTTGKLIPLPEPDARKIVAAAGLELGEWAFVATEADAAATIERFGRPCALKVVSPGVVHKSDVGGVRLNVTTENIHKAWESILSSVTRSAPDADITGMLLTPMAPSGVELHIGATMDPSYGPVVAFGTGGILIEALQDITFRAAPLTSLEAEEMINETLASRMLDGYRNFPPVDRGALVRFLVRVGELAANTPGVAELDLNPVIAGPAGLMPVDIRLVLSEEA